MMRFYCTLNERDRRRYAAIEAMKFGHGGIEYIARLFGCHRKTVSQGITELNSEQQLTTNRIRKKGEEEKTNGGLSRIGQERASYFA